MGSCPYASAHGRTPLVPHFKLTLPAVDVAGLKKIQLFNGLSHCYHLDEPTVIVSIYYRDIGLHVYEF